MEIQKETEALAAVIQKNPEGDYTEAGIQILMGKLVNKLATAEEEFEEMPVEKAGKLMVSLSRTKSYKDKTRQSMQRQIDLAFKGMEKEIMQTMKSDPKLVEDLKEILERTKTKMMELGD